MSESQEKRGERNPHLQRIFCVLCHLGRRYDESQLLLLLVFAVCVCYRSIVIIFYITMRKKLHTNGTARLLFLHIVRVLNTFRDLRVHRLGDDGYFRVQALNGVPHGVENSVRAVDEG